MVSWSSHPGLRASIILVAAVLVTGAVAAALTPAASPAAPALFPVCIDLGGQAGPDIAGNMVVWTDNRHGNLDIYGRNLSTRTDYAVCRSKAQQDNPSVTRFVTAERKAQYIAVWVDKRNHQTGDATDIYGRNITTRTNFIVSRSATIKWYPAICDEWVVWIEADDAAGPYRIKARDLAAGKSYLVATSQTLSPLAVSRRTVGTTIEHTAVYTSGKGDISGRDLPAGTPFVVSRTSKFEWSPDISANRVVWWESGGRVMLKNLKTGKRTFVATGARPQVDGKLVSWDGGGKGGVFALTYTAGAAIYVRDVTLDRSATKFTRPHQTLLFPALSWNRVVFESGKAKRVLNNIHIWGASW
jgi:beta propeller repeat protein